MLTTDDVIAILRKRFYERTEEDVASLVRFLSTDVAFFRRVPPQVIASAAERMEHSRVEGAPGSVMVREGDTNATHAFVILRGHCHVYRRKSGGDGDGDGGGGAGNGAAVVDESVASDDDLGELLDADVTVGDVVGELGAMMGEGGGGGGDGGAGGGRAVRWRRRNASVVTAHSSHPRTEFRETGVADWALDSGEHVLNLRTAVLHVSDTTGETIIAQIHGSVDEEIAKVIKLRWTRGR